jgi:hypothetical protein
MFKFIFAFFKKNHAKQSAKALSAFESVRKRLLLINQSASKQTVDNAIKVSKLQAENEALQAVYVKNTKVLENIDKLLGSE